MPCAADLERRDYLSFLLKRPQGTTKFLGTPAFGGTKAPAVLKSLTKGAETDCVETPVNCPHCGQK
nr:MAG TPA: cysteine-rich protein [Caudoviricetes sp.]